MQKMTRLIYSIFLSILIIFLLKKYVSFIRLQFIQKNLKYPTQLYDQVKTQVEYAPEPDDENLTPDYVVPYRSIRDQKLISQSTGYIIYNRVPKCGSETLAFVFGNTRKSNNKTGFLSSTYWAPGERHDRDLKYKKSIVPFIHELNNQTDQHFLYMRHMSFIDFSRFDFTPPIWINVIRNPVDRVVSAFYFQRLGFERNRVNGKMIDNVVKSIKNNREHETFESWVDLLLKYGPNGYVNITQSDGVSYKQFRLGPYAIQLSYLCGTEEFCDGAKNYEYYIRSELNQIESINPKIYVRGEEFTQTTKNLYQSMLKSNPNDTHFRIGKFKARDQAIHNIQYNYLVVGILEQLEDFLELLEYIFPDDFRRNLSGRRTRFLDFLGKRNNSKISFWHSEKLNIHI